jgi:hypothetical protein
MTQVRYVYVVIGLSDGPWGNAVTKSYSKDHADRLAEMATKNGWPVRRYTFVRKVGAPVTTPLAYVEWNESEDHPPGVVPNRGSLGGLFQQISSLPVVDCLECAHLPEHWNMSFAGFLCTKTGAWIPQRLIRRGRCHAFELSIKKAN